MSEFFRNVQSSLPNFSATTSSGFDTATIAYVLLGVLAVYFIGLMLLNKPIDFSWLDPRPKSMKTTSDAYLFWKPSKIFTNLRIPGDSIPGFSNNLYTLNVEGLLINTRNFKGTGGPWRHILHRGSDELAVTTLGGALTQGKCVSAFNGVGALPVDGVPKRMNPGIFLDPNTNDIVVFVDTERSGDSFRESVRIVDVPMDIPFRLGVIVNGKVLEVYLNCKLEVSKVLSGQPRSVENVWYGLAGAAAAQAQIQNLYIWKRAVQADQIGSLCPGIPKFKKRPICDGADVVPDMDLGAGGPKQETNVGFGTALSNCPAPK